VFRTGGERHPASWPHGTPTRILRRLFKARTASPSTFATGSIRSHLSLAVSSNLRWADARSREVSIANAWAFEAELLAGDDRKAARLTFDDHGRPFVALDVKDKATNGFLLKRLERDSE
jgi:hypothetical protein